MNESSHIPVYEYAKLHKVSEQNVYRWIRENRFKNEDVDIKEKIVKRIYINKNAIRS